MGVTLGDFTGDQRVDVYLSDLGDNELLRRASEPELLGRLQFVKEERGIGRIRPPGEGPNIISSSWASGLADLNLDGNLDLVVVNGGFPGRTVENKVPQTRIAASDPPAIFMGFSGSVPRWADVWPDLGIEWEGAGRGLALGDLDGDLDTDIVISTRDAGLRVFRNDIEGPSVRFALAGPCDPTGVFLSVFTEPFPLLVPLAAPTFLGRNAPEFILGLGGPGRYSLTADGPDLRTDDNGRRRLDVTCADADRTTLR